MAERFDTWVMLKRATGFVPVALALSITSLQGAAPAAPSPSPDKPVVGLSSPRAEPDFPAEIVRQESDLRLDEAGKGRAAANAHFATGLIYELKRESEKAFEHFHKAALADPSRERLVVTVVDRFVRRKQPEKALELLKKAVAEEGASGRLHGLLGVVYSELGRQAEAVAEINKAIQQDPGELPPYIFLAKAHREKMEFAASLKTLKDALVAVPGSPGSFFALAEEALKIPNQDKEVHEEAHKFAIGLLDKVEIDDVRNLALLDRLATSYNLAGAADKAISVYQDALKKFPDSMRLRLGLADLCLRNERWELAEEQLNYLIGRRPEAAGSIYVQLAHIAVERKDYPTAERHYEKAILLEPDKETTYYELARLQAFEDREDRAAETLAKAREKFPPSFSMEYTAAVLHNRKDRFEEASESFVAAEKLAKATEPERLTHFFYHEMGATFERGKFYRRAERYFRIVLKQEPEFAETLNYMGYMWTELEINLPEARAMIEKALRQEPENAAFLDSMAWVLHKQGEPESALDWQLKAVRFAEEADAVLYDHLGDIYAALDRMKEARNAWEKSLAAEPDDAVAAKLGRTAKPAPVSKTP